MSKGNGKTEQDFLGKGFHKLDENLVDRKAPKIQWGDKFQAMPDADKILYLKRLASTMNHAAYLIQNERNQLLDLMEKKELQLEAMKRSIEQNNEMIQGQITEMNANKQEYHKKIASLNKKLREYENGDISRLGD
jgi:hypothetical protein